MRISKLYAMLILLLMSQLKAVAYTTGDQVTFDGITYAVIDAKNNTLAVMKVSGIEDLVIPATVFDGKDVTFRVTTLGNGQTTTLSGVKTITIPEGVTTLAAYALRSSSITSLHIPASVTTINNQVAYTLPKTVTEITVAEGNANYVAVDGSLYTKDMKTLVAYAKGKALTNNTYTVADGVETIGANSLCGINTLKKVVIPASVKTISEASYCITNGCGNLAAFEVDENNQNYCSVDGVLFNKAKTKLIAYPIAKGSGKSYTVPDGVTEIASYAMYGSKIKELDLNQVTKLGSRSFFNCKNLISVTLPAAMTDFNNGAFDGCSAIANYFVAEGNTKYADIDGILFSADKKTLLKYPGGRTDETYEIPEGTTQIAEKAFYPAKFSTVKIASTVKSVGTWGFRECTNLSSIVFAEPSSLESFGNSCFWGCHQLEEIKLPSSLKTLGSATFYSMRGLKKVIVPDGSQLTTIGSSVISECPQFEEFVFEGSCTLQTISSRAFSNLQNLKSFTFPASLKTIATAAFNGCKNLETVTFADDAVIETIGEGAFANSGLKSLKLPESVVTIQKEAFWNCDVLEEVSLSKNAKTISSQAFKGCSKLKRILVAEDNPYLSSVQGFLCSKDKSTLILFPPGAARKDFTLLPPSLTAIGEYAFYDCAELTNISIPAKVNTIGKRAFGLDTNLSSIAFLCDEPISPAKISMALNEAAIDDGTTAPTNAFENITIYVRKELVDKYKNESPYKEFYSRFKDIKSSFTMAHDGDLSSGDGDEFFPMSNTAVNLLSTSAKVKTYVVPAKVTNPEDGVEYTVSLIGDYAFDGVDANIEEVIVKSDVGYIGAMAFVTNVQRTKDNKIKPKSSSIKQIVFTTNEPAEWLSKQYFGLSDDFKEFLPTQKIFVKKSACEEYKGAWTDFSSQIDYKIPGISINKMFGTFAREFDVDLADYTTDGGEGRVYAFTAAPNGIKAGTGDYSETEYHIHMHSINEGQAGDGTYIPAGTGVLLKSMDATQTPADFYYTIGEKDVNVAAESCMVGVTVNNESVTDTDKDLYVMSGGVFKALAGKTVNMPVHKAYLKAEGSNGAKLVLSFDDGETTAIDNMATLDEQDESTDCYTLQGVRVNGKLQRGIYIKNGKKIIVK